jgi:hypothetical protein
LVGHTGIEGHESVDEYKVINGKVIPSPASSSVSAVKNVLDREIDIDSSALTSNLDAVC